MWTDADKERGKELIREMKPGQKAGYVMTYYWGWILLVVIGIIIAIWGVYRYTHPGPKDLVNVELVGAAQPTEEVWDIFDQYMVDYDIDQETETVNMTIVESTDYTTQLILARLMTGEVDLLTMDEDTMAVMVSGDGMMELDEVLSPDLLEEYEDRLFYGIDEMTGEAHVYGVLLKDGNPLMQAAYYGEPVWACIAYNADHPEMAVSVLEYLLSAE